MNERQKKKFRRTIQMHGLKIDHFEAYYNKERLENRIIGLILVIGVPLANWLLPKFMTPTMFNMTINPALGPIDLLFMATGIRFLWRSR